MSSTSSNNTNAARTPQGSAPRRRRSHWAWLVLAFALFVGHFAYLFATRGVSAVLWHGPFAPRQHVYSEAAYLQTKANAQLILDAILAYHHDFNDCPASLDGLVPQHLPSINLPTVGFGRWDYQRVAPDRFTLKFHVGPTYESDSYDSSTGEWKTDR